MYLSHYKGILNNTELPFYLQSKKVSVKYDANDTLEELWAIHDNAIEKEIVCDKPPKQSLLDLKIDISTRLFSDCVLCEHRCHVDRKKESGKCKLTSPIIASECIHNGEEKIFVPSHTIFFSGCNFQCVFCQNYDISQYQKGIIISPDELTTIIDSRYKCESINANWVGGEPTPNLLFILQTIKQLNIPIPQIWNSNMYCSEETMKLLNGVIDVFLTDFKFGNNRCAERLANIQHYFEMVSRNHLIAIKNADVFIRHLVLPNHISCCSKPILTWIKNHTPECMVNIMDQYHPAYKARSIKELQNICNTDEIQEVREFAKKLSLNIMND